MKNKAFTLIELLVVIAIIGILATVVIASLNSVRSKARDAKRKNELQAISKAYQMYYADNGAYPANSAHSVQDGTAWSTNWIAHQASLAPYISLSDVMSSRYVFINNGRCGQVGQTGVYIFVQLENALSSPYNPCGNNSGDIFYNEAENTRINNGLIYAIRLQ